MKSYGQTAYEAYLKYSDGKSMVSGVVLPSWPDLESKIRDAWGKAGEAVVEDYERHVDVNSLAKCSRQ